MAKQKTTFLEFGYKEDKKKTVGELGLTYGKQKGKDVKKAKIENKELKIVPYILCPICCKNQPLNRTGTYRRNMNKASKKKDFKDGKKVEFRSTKYNPNKETTFGKFDFENSPFVSIRQVTGSEGIVEIEIITISQVKSMSVSDRKKIIPIIEKIRESCFKTLELTEELI
ncbi:MAG: hypothetical protein Q8K02_00385 [Flavobacterium sp.]|nr:hypothetical protein [Flavobacterium sp.]